ncbi:MAG: glucose-6-phosphate dehydrogenase [Candidatus Babeliales bacterium]
MIDCTFIILGATGDLAKRKLIPALYKLVQDKKIRNFLIVGAALEQVTADECIDRGRIFIPNVDEEIWRRLKKSFYYQQLDFNDHKGFKHLNQFIDSLEKEHSFAGNRLVYMAVPSLFFCTITKHLGASGIVKKSDSKGLVGGHWQRIIYEKPFGTSLESARDINACIHEYFNENQIYRIDHYLTKELVGSILLARFTNMIFEPLWNSNYIEEVQIILSETLGVEGRGIYYDQYGVLKDMVQNHMLQLMALVAMELPEQLDAHYIRDQKAAVLKKIKCVGGVLGQYDGYLQEKNVASNSQTPTFALLAMHVDTPRWKGVPFYIKTGKTLFHKNSSIHIKFKEVSCKLRDRCMYTSDYLSIQIDPDSSFSLQLNIKKPGQTYEVTPVNLHFSHNYVFGTTTPEAYEVLLEQIMMGEQSVSVRFDEIESSWHIIEQIEQLKLPVLPYKQSSQGPHEAELFAEKHKLWWRA